ncbi:MAG: leucine-rich repeat domain-containing protein, partial [Clostridiales bacterium]|nr:leucine-rich repeat domain-containing protein [Clostridiales bacterium]
MAEYKKKRLQICEDGVFKQNKKPYNHILPENLKELNIIEIFRKEFWNYLFMNEDIKLHTGFHHLNSSQGMCFNLFYPLINEYIFSYQYRNYDYIKCLLDFVLKDFYHNFKGLSDIDFLKPTQLNFEKVLDKKEQTNFDFCLELKNNVKILFEIKFTEEHYGTAKNSKSHEDKFHKIYKPKLINKIQPEYCSFNENFRNNYQIIRNLSYIDDKTYVVFLYPNKNENIKNKNKTIIEGIILPKYQNHIKILYLGDLVEHLLNGKYSSAKIHTHYQMFKEKYLLDEDIDYNYFNNLDEALYFPEIVTTLDLSHQYRTKFPMELLTLKNLQKLDLSGGEFENIPDEIWNFEDLVELSLNISIIPKEIKNLKRLRLLEISGKDLKKIPDEISEFALLETLIISNCEICKLPESIEKLTSLRCIKLINLPNLDLVDTFKKLSLLKYLKVLDLSGNDLYDLPPEISLLQKLNELDLSLNNFSKIPEAIFKLSELTDLSLENNKLKSIDKKITKLSDLTCLDLRSNNIKQLPKEIHTLPYLKHLML